MEYYKLLQLEEEPFSNSPDPDYFFQSRQHLSCIQKLEVALRLKRGLNVIIGDVGTGKTTLCREVIRRFAGDSDVETHLILDPSIPSADEFLSIIYAMLCNHPQQPANSTTEKKEAVKQALFEKGVQENKTVVLIIDEGQKITPGCLEILRELLNYETNSSKLLQIVIFAQQEFVEILESHPNFADRINFLYHLAPMNFSDTRRMIHHRLKLASSLPKPVQLFTLPALWAIYRYSKGYPRRIVHLCHQSVLAMIIQNRSRAGWKLVRACKKRLAPVSRFGLKAKTALGVLCILMICAAGIYHFYPRWDAYQQLQARLLPIPATLMSRSESAMDSDTPVEKMAEDKTSSQETLLEPFPEPLDNDTADSKLVPDSQIESIVTAIDTYDIIYAPADQPTLIAALETEEDIRSHEPDSPVSTPPLLLGALHVLYGDTLYKMIRRVYGVYLPSYLNAVLESNPQIIDPNKIETYQSIWFPAIEFDPNPLLSQCAWIVLDQKKTMDQAILRLNQLASLERLAVQMIGGWSAEEDLHFYLALRGYFTNRDKAASFLEVLPEDIASQASIITDWPAKTTLYSDPYLGGIR